ncbi:MAG: hypothetical protein M3404_02380 [Actinomycetota bacterium]|nr:hypothetical protein [Actinomycetota bacterium]
MTRAGVVKAAALGALVVAAVVGAIASRQPGRSEEARPFPPASNTPPAVSTGAEARTLGGARTAALRYLALAEAVVRMDEAEAVAAQREAATAAAADALASELSDKLARLRNAYSNGAVAYRLGPLAARASMLSPDRARVEIWYVGVVAPEASSTYEEWRMARYDLAWERGAWRVAGESSGPGPRPGPESSSEVLGRTLAGFSSVLTPA